MNIRSRSRLTDVLLVICVVLAIALLWRLKVPLVEKRVEKTATNGKVYTVRNTKDAQATADALARLEDKLRHFIGVIQVAAEKDISRRPMVNRIASRFQHSKMSEGIVDRRYTSYTYEKTHIVMCMRSRDGRDQLYEDNTVLGVAIHELAHIGSVSLGHGPEFKDNFAWLLKVASEAGLYKRILEPFQYCGMTVGSL